jgi:hypothetical protein
MAKYVAGSLLIDPVNSKPSEPQGRLTLTTLVPVLIAAVSASATVRYTPYKGNKIPIWNGTLFEMRTFSELTNTLADSTDNPAAGAAAKVYDLFVGYKNGNLILARDVAWTNDTTPTGSSTVPRAGLNYVNGVLVNENVIANCFAAGYGTYVGTIRTDAGGATVSQTFATSGAGGSAGSMYVWNAYNQVEMRCLAASTTASYTYASATVRATEGGNLVRVNVVRGLNDRPIDAIYFCLMTLAAVSGSYGLIGIALDATNAISGKRGQILSQAAVAVSGVPEARYNNYPGLGAHFLQATESGDGTNNVTFAPNGNENTGALTVKHWC